MSRQLKPLFGVDGLLPAAAYFELLRRQVGGGLQGFFAAPTVFWMGASEGLMLGLCLAGLIGSLVVVAGFANAPIMLFLWASYMSLIEVGQVWYGYGWEILLLEAGFLAVFLCPWWDPRPFPPRTPPPSGVMVLFRWLLFRVMFGAGLIKLRGDPCWRDLTCLVFHYETQPLPNPLSWYLHQAPVWFHKGGVLFNHFVELIAPFMLFGPRRWRHWGGLFQVVFQVGLILSGNLSWLNYLTIAVALAAFDDSVWRKLLPKRITAMAHGAEALNTAPTVARKRVILMLAIVVALLSFNPVANMVGPRQAMNRSFDPFHLVNTYGAFGSVGEKRYEVILQGTNDDPRRLSARWRDYEFKCKPGDVSRRPCVTAPYQHRLDWQIWFAAMSDYRSHPWLLHLMAKLLLGDAPTLALMGPNPFAEKPPKFIRAELYLYRFTKPGEGAWWSREHVAPYLPPFSRDDPRLRAFLQGYGWTRTLERL